MVAGIRYLILTLCVRVDLAIGPGNTVSDNGERKEAFNGSIVGECVETCPVTNVWLEFGDLVRALATGSVIYSNALTVDNARLTGAWAREVIRCHPGGGGKSHEDGEQLAVIHVHW